MAVKFSGFTAEATAATTELVGYKTGTTVNTRYSLAQVATGLKEHLTESFIVACSDETTDLAVADGVVTFQLPYDFTLLAGIEGVRASVNTAPVGSTITIDIEIGGSTILSTLLTIDASEKTSYTALAPVIISDTTLTQNVEIKVNIDQIGSGTAGKGLKVMLIGYQT
jgi:hypothetical protein